MGGIRRGEICRKDSLRDFPRRFAVNLCESCGRVVAVIRQKFRCESSTLRGIFGRIRGEFGRWVAAENWIVGVAGFGANLGAFAGAFAAWIRKRFAAALI